MADGSKPATGNKQWVDHDNVLGLRPKTVSIVLTRDEQIIARRSISAKNGWQYHFIDLPTFAQNGHRYVYAISESSVAYYTSKHIGGNLINTIKPETRSQMISPTQPIVSTWSKSPTPKTDPKASKTPASHQ